MSSIPRFGSRILRLIACVALLTCLEPRVAASGSSFDTTRGTDQAPGNQPCPGCGIPLPPAGWDWGEIVVAPGVYKGILTLRNECAVPTTVTFNLEAPYVRFPYLFSYPDVNLNAGEVREVHAEVKMVYAPCMIIITHQGFSPYPPFGGKLQLTYKGEGESCLAKVEEYPIYGHLLFPPRKCDDDSPKPEKLLSTDPCTQWWLTGNRPVSDNDLDAMCLAPIRELAAAYRERALDALVKSEPDRWAWLPSASAIRNMSIADILAIKRRSEEQIKGR